MNGIRFAAALLRARLLLMRTGPAVCVALALCLPGLGAWAWLLPQQAALVRRAVLPPTPAIPAPAVPAPLSSNQNLTLFYATLGDQRDAEQQLQTLFALAARTGLVLSQGDYKAGYDQASRVSTYEIVLPVKGSYQSVWRFSALALRAMPFAALDEINFRRETIGDAAPEARLRLTLFLNPLAPERAP